jgi:hypothetical protein
MRPERFIDAVVADCMGAALSRRSSEKGAKSGLGKTSSGAHLFNATDIA